MKTASETEATYIDAHQGLGGDNEPFGYIDGWFICWTFDDNMELSYTLDRDTEADEDDDFVECDVAAAAVDAWLGNLRPSTEEEITRANIEADLWQARQ